MDRILTRKEREHSVTIICDNKGHNELVCTALNAIANQSDEVILEMISMMSHEVGTFKDILKQSDL